MFTTTNSPIIRSLLETDLYKLTMLQAMQHQMPNNTAEYRFICRGKPLFPLGSLAPLVNEQLDAVCTLRFSPAELEYLRGLRFMKPGFVEFLRLFQYERRFITAQAQGDDLVITAKGPQVHVMGFELVVLPIVQELYMQKAMQGHDAGEFERRLDDKIASATAKLSRLEDQYPDAKPFELFDFGLRRRASGLWQEAVVKTLIERMPGYFKGTSNVDLARRFGLVAIGTMAHEWLQTFQAMPGVQLRQSTSAALEAWVKEYRGDLGIALTDVITTDAFLKDFDLYFAKLFDGLRQDSGVPLEWADKVDARYRELRIDPATKRKVFSDGLSLDSAIDLWAVINGERGQMSGYGIGTNLTNDGPVPALSMVMKLTDCNGQPTAKISDSKGKTACEDVGFVNYLRQVYHVGQ
jgi:nicotinate phosphoribosyltransferase